MSKSRTTTKYKDGDKLPPIHPGEILKTEFMQPLDLSATQLALHMGIPLSRVIMIVNCKRNVTADTAFRLARVFKTTPEFWLNLQSQYEVAMLDYTGATKKDLLGSQRIFWDAQAKLRNSYIKGKAFAFPFLVLVWFKNELEP